MQILKKPFELTYEFSIMIKKFYYLCLILILSIGVWIPACNVEGDINDPCGCPTVNQFFDVEGITLRNMNKNFFLREDALNVLNWEDYNLALNFTGRFYGKLEHSFPLFSTISRAYACSCPKPGDGGSKERVETIHIISLHDFDENHSAGDTINEFVYIDHYFDSESNTEIAEMPLDEFMANGSRRITRPLFRFGLSHAPFLNDTLQLALHIKLDNGEFYEAEVEPVFIVD